MALITGCIVLAALAGITALVTGIQGQPVWVPCLAVGIALAAFAAGAALTLNHLAEPVRAPIAVTEAHA
ncbi:hypothetical protein GCM10017559_07980 [Streptosporangium longisporum]|uniref:Uncharacterized protein n=1 Tax=Streptosporangium longisporum TaxID=46187 RepID=A0ABN3XRI6_9ACTN